MPELRLLEFERTALVEATTVSAVTFFTGAPPTEYLHARVAAVVQANPWLAGRLVRSRWGRLRVQHPGTEMELGTGLEVADVEGLKPDTPYDDMQERLLGFAVKRGALCINVDEPLFRVVLLRTGTEGFGLLVSLSHLLGDAYTLYRLQAMLGAGVCMLFDGVSKS